MADRCKPPPEPHAGAETPTGDPEGSAVVVAHEDLMDIGKSILNIAKSVARRSLYEGFEPSEALGVVARAFHHLAAGERPWAKAIPARTVLVDRNTLEHLGEEISRISRGPQPSPATVPEMLARVDDLSTILWQISTLLDAQMENPRLGTDSDRGAAM